MVDSLDVAQKFDYQFKLIIVGDTGVGKSCILDRYLKDKHLPGQKPTVGVEFGLKYLPVNDKVIKL